jgi:TonB family protein
MDALLEYFLKANFAFAAFYIFYRLLLHRDTFFKEKRLAFLLGFIFALLYPLIDISTLIEGNKPVIYVAKSIGTNLPEIYINGGNLSGLTTQDIIFILYGIVTTFLLLRILWQIISVLLMSASSEKKKINNLTIVHLPAGSSPFSFFGMVFLNPNDFNSKDLDEILHHESVHIRQFHTIDVIFAELICAFFWINPAIWLMKRHLRENLEYLADNDVIHSGIDPKGYQYHLLRLSYQQTTTSIANHFNVTQLKKRIIMMNKKKTSLAGLGKYALSLPLFVFLLLAAYTWGVKTELPSLNEISEVALQSVKEEKPAGVVKDKESQKHENAETSGKEKVYNTVDKMPVYPGGEQELMKLILGNLHYPTKAKEAGIEGRVIIRFVVSKTGDVTNVEVMRGLDSSCDEEAIRVVKMMPKWIPGQQNGKDVPVYFTLPIVYRLNKDGIKTAKKGIEINNADGTKPYVLVDGKETKLENIDKDAIESISVLKDKAATELYGEKGAYGVILITMKKNTFKPTSVDSLVVK